MNILDLFSLCFKNLLRRRTRSLLAIMGVVVGTCSVVLMLSIGFGLTKSYEAEIESYGNLHMITINYWGGESNGGKEGQKGILNDETLEDISNIEGVTAVTPVISDNMTIAAGKYIANLQIKGINPEVFEKFNYELKDGRMLTITDKNVLLFGSSVLEWFYNPQSKHYDSKTIDVMREDLILTGDGFYGHKAGEIPEDNPKYEVYDVKAAGVLAETNDNSDYSVYMNLEALEKIKKETAKTNKERIVQNQGKGRTYQEALVYIQDLSFVEDINSNLKDQGYQTSSPIDWLQAMKKTSQMIQMILGGIGGISLIVAALGITNTMIMSVYERTREIGVMKVIGANLADIRSMFLLEAAMIGGIGGMVGVALSGIISLLLNTVFFDVVSSALGAIGGGNGTVISYVPLWLVFAAIGFATAIGVFAGYSPANRAMKMSALESLKNE